jgi:hypothetical protein
MTMENWNNLLVIMLTSDISVAVSVIFLISWIFIGNYVLLNLLFAVLLDGFDNNRVNLDIKSLEEEFDVKENLEFDEVDQLTLQTQTNQANLSITSLDLEENSRFNEKFQSLANI